MPHAPYAVLADMEALWGVNDVTISSDWDDTGAIVLINVTNALQAATDFMDRYIAVRYTVPLQTVPDDLIRVCCDIGMYLMCPTATTMTDQKQKRYDQAVKFLRDLSDGKATLGDQQNAEIAATTATIQPGGAGGAVSLLNNDLTLTLLNQDSMRRLL